MSDTVTLTLAHPLDAKQAERLHAKEKKDYKTGDKITVPRDDGRAIINAGYAKDIDPGDTGQVLAALGETPPPATKSSKSST